MRERQILLSLLLAALVLCGWSYLNSRVVWVHSRDPDPTAASAAMLNNFFAPAEFVTACTAALVPPDNCTQLYRQFIAETGTSNDTDGKTHAHAMFLRQVLAAATQGRSSDVELYDSASGDGMGQRLDVFTSGGAWSDGDEGSINLRGAVTDTPGVGDATLDASYSSSTSGVSGAAFTADGNADWVYFGSGKLVIFDQKTPTAVTVTGFDSTTGIVTLSADPGDVAGRCFGSDSNGSISTNEGETFPYVQLIIEDENTADSNADPTKLSATNWTATGALTAGQIRLRWMAIGSDQRIPPGLDIPNGAASIYECAQIEAVTFAAGLRPTTGSLTFAPSPTGRNACTGGVDCSIRAIPYGESRMGAGLVTLTARLGRGAAGARHRGWQIKNNGGFRLSAGYKCQGADQDGSYGIEDCVQVTDTRTAFQFIYMDRDDFATEGHGPISLHPNAEAVAANDCHPIIEWGSNGPGGTLDLYWDPSDAKIEVGNASTCVGTAIH